MEIGRFDLATCTYTLIVTDIDIWFADFLLADNDVWYLLGEINTNPALYTLDPVTGNTTLLHTFPNYQVGGTIMQLNPDTLVVVSGGSYYLFDLNTNNATYLGYFNSNHSAEMFVYQGNVYLNRPGGLYEVTLVPTLSFNLVLSPASNIGFPTGVCNKVFSIGEPGTSITKIYEYDITNNTYNILCYDIDNLIPNFNFGYLSSINVSLAPDPDNPIGPLCDCISESGTFSSSGVINGCAGQPIVLPHNGDDILDGDDILVFALTTSNSNGSESIFLNYPDNVLHQYTQPLAEFLPGITEYGVIYRIYAIAGNALGDGVDFFDVCREISAPIAVRWRPSPSVSFSAQNACPSGCQMVDVAFTGTGPYTLTYQVTAGATQQTFTQTFGNSTASIQVCPPPGYEGAVEVQATALMDAWCTCQ